MATLKIWNIEDELILFDESETIGSLEYVLDAFNDEHNLFASGGLGYDIKISVNDDLLMRKDELEYENGSIAGRYELRV